jgi:ribosomal-protein-alanine N-acetyltransferase
MRRLTSIDARDMAAIHAKSFERSWDPLEMAVHTQKDVCLGVDAEAGLAGFIIISIAADQAEVLTIATAPNMRRTGLGKSLLAAAEAALKSHNAVELFLEVAEDNAAAIALYRSAGFTPIGRRPRYYRREAGRVAAISFSKKLSKTST